MTDEGAFFWPAWLQLSRLVRTASAFWSKASRKEPRSWACCKAPEPPEPSHSTLTTLSVSCNTWRDGQFSIVSVGVAGICRLYNTLPVNLLQLLVNQRIHLLTRGCSVGEINRNGVRVQERSRHWRSGCIYTSIKVDLPSSWRSSGESGAGSAGSAFCSSASVLSIFAFEEEERTFADF